MSYEIVFRAPPAGTPLAAWLAAPSRGAPIATATLRALAAELADRVGATVDEANYRFALEGGDVAFELDAYGGRCDVPGVDVVWELLDTVCERTGWVAYDPQAGRIVFGASGRWAERAFALLVQHRALEVRPENRPVALRILRKIGGYFHDDPATAVAELIVFAEIEPAIEELFGDATELIAVLQTLS